MVSDLTLRAARRDSSDGVAFARYVDIAADGIFGQMLGGAAERVLAEAFLEPGHDMSYEHATFAERDGVVVGMSSAYSSEQHAASSERPLIRAAGWRAIRLAAFALAARRMFQFLDTLPDGDYYLLALAVDDDQRGEGIGSVLMEHVWEQAREADCTRIALDVAVDNTHARRLYERNGMTVEATSPKLRLLPDARVHRMVARI